MASELLVLSPTDRSAKTAVQSRLFSGTARVEDKKGCSETITSLGAGIEFHSQKNQASGFPDRPPKVRANEALPR